MSRTAFLFPGQGAQAVGMGRELYLSLKAAKDLFQRANCVLGYDLAQLCFEGPVEQLNATIVSQPALYVTSLAALEHSKTTVPHAIEHCQAAAGLSLGEYTAIVFAGGLDFEEGLRLVQLRGQAMQDAADQRASAMLSVLGLDREQVSQVCDAARVEGEILQIANMLCPGNIAVSGDIASCGNVDEVAKQAGAIKIVPLAVAGAFHTPIMQPAVEQLARALDQVKLRATRIPVYSNVDARPHTDPGEIQQLLVQQICQPVLWEDSMTRMLHDGFNQFYEIGPGRVLRGLLKRIDRKTPCSGVLD